MTSNSNDKREGEESKLRAIAQSLAQAIRKKDVARTVSHYAPDAILFGLAPPLSRPRTGLEKDLDAWFSTWEGEVGYEVCDQTFVIGDELALGTSFLHIYGEKTDGEPADIWVRATHGFRKVHGAWIIANEHISVPFYMDGSERAATDLKP